MEKENNKKCDCGNCKNCKNCKKGKGKSSLYVGTWLLFLGVFFLASNFGLFNYADFSKTWPIFMIIPGVLFIMRGLSSRNDS